MALIAVTHALATQNFYRGGGDAHCLEIRPTSAYHTGSGLIGAGLVGLFSVGVTFGILAVLFETIRAPVIRRIVALVFAAPAAVAGFALVHGEVVRLI